MVTFELRITAQTCISVNLIHIPKHSSILIICQFTWYKLRILRYKNTCHASYKYIKTTPICFAGDNDVMSCNFRVYSDTFAVNLRMLQFQCSLTNVYIYSACSWCTYEVLLKIWPAKMQLAINVNITHFPYTSQIIYMKLYSLGKMYYFHYKKKFTVNNLLK